MEIKMLEKPTELVIDRSMWYRGRGELESRLVREDGMMCCLGFYGLACGIKKDDMLDIHDPEFLYMRTNKVLPDMLTYDYEHSNITGKLINYNDSISLSEEKREQLISSCFEKIGVKVIFIN